MSQADSVDSLRHELQKTFDELGLLVRASFPGGRVDLLEAFMGSMRTFVRLEQEQGQEIVKRVFTLAHEQFKLPLVLAVFGSEFEATFPPHESLDCVRMVVGCKDTANGFAAVWRA